jgi:Dyp-type peroxidase family
VRVDPGNVQGNVLRSYGGEFNHARYVFLKFCQPGPPDDQAKTGLAQALDQVSFGSRTARERRGKDSKVNLAFTHKGLEALGLLPADMLAAFPEDFCQGGEQRAKEKLNESWPTADGTIPLGRSHLMVSIHTCCVADGDKSHSGCKAESERVYDTLRLPGGSFERVHMLDSFQSGTDRERFGFSDGFSQPAVEGVDIDPVGKGVYVGTQARGGIRARVDRLAENVTLSPWPRGWRPIRTGEFLLGYENEDGDLPAGPPAPLGPNGTFMVYREFDQNRDLFREFISKAADKTGLAEEELKAKIVGRWPDGSPAVRFPPEESDPANHVDGMRFRANDFHYREDPRGWGCPLGAHVRRANPRDSLPGGGEQTMRHRIIRRGMPFVIGDPEHPERQGLAFVCLSASIASGFEFIQRNWISNGAAFGLGSARDFLFQESPQDKMVIPGYRPIILEPPEKPFVTVRGCEYFFVPSRVACAWLAALLRS